MWKKTKKVRYFPILNKIVLNKSWAYSKNGSLETYFCHFLIKKTIFTQGLPLFFELWKIRKFQIGEDSDLIGQKYYSFCYVGALNWWILIKKISYIKICSRVFFTPRVFFNDSFLCVPLHILYIFSTTWKFVFFSDLLCYDWWTLTKFSNSLNKRGSRLNESTF